MIYSNLPVYVGDVNTDNVNTGDLLIPLSVSVNRTANIQPKRNFKITEQAREAESYLGCQIDLTFLLNTNRNSTQFLDESNATGYFPIKIGNNDYYKCLVNSFEYDIQPFNPVACRASFTCFNAPANEQISGNSIDNSSIESSGMVYGHNVVVNNSPQTVLSRLVYKVDYNRTPVYELGSATASKWLLNSHERSLSIESTGLSNLIDYSGDNVSSDITIQFYDENSNQWFPNDNGAALIPTISSGSKILDQKYSSQEGDSLVTDMSIRQIVV